tara:strand:+ start:2074 stop:2328 length:255 start_codon:yes stop_codon:yes gene_type:complete
MIKTEVKTTVPENAKLIDDAFCVMETRFMWKSMRQIDGEWKDFLFGLTEKVVTDMSRWHLKCEQEGTLEQYSRVVGSAIVGGKL